MQPLDEVLGDGKLPDEPIELGIHGGLEHLVGGEGFGIAGFEADPLAALAIDPFVRANSTAAARL